LVTEYVYGLDLIEESDGGENEEFFGVDGLGSTVVLTDGNGEVIETYEYDEFGELADAAGELATDYLFAGEQFDESLGDYYLRQRYYDPTIGRFTRKDTYEGRLAEPITLNKFVYGNSNPVSYVDPSGLSSGLIGLTARSQIEIALIAASLAAASISLVSSHNSSRFASPSDISEFLLEIGYYVAAKTSSDSSKNEKHGDGGRAKAKAEKQINELKEKLKNATTRREKVKINNKIKKIRRTAEDAGDGEEHSRSKKR
ncbi:MAG: RHS repeat-associated core domain-containing protein, partial [Spirulina sp. SIO3F2]|nr:RHS repeat-associated core domain-containing protein [Spirulina sp. SIO3F2]